MTIDIHSHLFVREFFHESYLDWEAQQTAGDMSQRLGKPITAVRGKDDHLHPERGGLRSGRKGSRAGSLTFREGGVD